MTNSPRKCCAGFMFVLAITSLQGKASALRSSESEPVPSAGTVSNAKGEGSPEIGETAGGCTCVVAADCRLCLEDNACNCAQCVAGMCEFTCTKYGDLDCSGSVNLNDILCALVGFSSQSGCPNADIEPCGGDGDVDICDLDAVLNGFIGVNTCACTENAAPGGGVPPLCGSISPPPPGGGDGEPLEGPSDAFATCALSAAVANPGDAVSLDVFIQSISGLSSYQTTIVITRLSGTGTLDVSCPEGVSIDSARPDYVFAGEQIFPLVNCDGLSSGALLGFSTPSVDVGSTPAYLSTVSMTVSVDASPGSIFEIEILPPPTSRMGDSSCAPIPFEVGPPCILQLAGCACDGDIAPPGGDGDVNLDDIVTSLGCVCTLSPNPECDVNCDGVTDLTDVGIEICQFGGGGTNCCSALFGACQRDSDTFCCIETSENGCIFFGGQYLGDGTTCPIITVDCDNNGTPDHCQSDCDCNGTPDTCELQDNDCNGNSIPDNCEGVTATCHGDVNNDMVIDNDDEFIVENCVRCIGSPNPACDVNCDGQVTTRDYGDVYCLQTLTPAECCAPPHGACRKISLPFRCIITSEAYCDFVNGTFGGDDSTCGFTDLDANDNGIGDSCPNEPGACVGADDCADIDPCTCNRCNSTYHVCQEIPARPGDANCDCIPATNLDDILCVLNGFTDYDNCPNADIHRSPDGACAPDIDIDLDDILRVLSTFAGMGPCVAIVCSQACQSGACCQGLFCSENSSINCFGVGGDFTAGVDCDEPPPFDPCP